MLQVIERSFAKELKTAGWSAKVKAMIPSYGQSLIEDPALSRRVRAETAAILNINNVTTRETENDPSLSTVHGA
jgi:malate dehydrogenase (quinone)